MRSTLFSPSPPKMLIFPWLLHLFLRGRGSTYYYVCRCSTCIWALCTRATAQTRAFMKRVVQSSPSPAQPSMQNPKETSPAGGGGGGARACVPRARFPPDFLCFVELASFLVLLVVSYILLRLSSRCCCYLWYTYFLVLPSVLPPASLPLQRTLASGY